MIEERSRTGRLIVLVMALVASCTSPAPGDSRPQDPSSAPRESAAVASSGPSATSETLPSASPTGSGAPRPSRRPGAAPVATLDVGGERFAGEVGGFTFGTHTDSAPWLPATALETVTIGAGAQLTIELDDQATIAAWRLGLADAADVTADRVTGLGEGLGPPIAFPAPPIGDWVLSASITYGSGAGDGAYYWHLVVR